MFVLIVSLVIGEVNWVRVIGPSETPLSPKRLVLKSDSLGVLIRTTIFGFTTEDTVVDDRSLKHIRIPGAEIKLDTLEAGKPEIPYIRLLIAVPDSASISVNPHNLNFVEFINYVLYPIPSILFEEDSFGCFYPKEIYAYDTTFYNTDTLYPGKFYDINSDGYWRDQRVLEVLLYPIQFNPYQQRMYFYHGLDIQIEYAGEVIKNVNGLGPFEQIGKEILLNYQTVDWQPDPNRTPAVHYYTDLRNPDNVADYIIVTDDAFIVNETASYWIYEFAQHRVDHNQFDVAVVRTQDIYTEWPPPDPDSLHISLKQFLEYAFANWISSATLDGHFSYCLFIGDWDYVPSKLSVNGTDVNVYEGYFRHLHPSPDEAAMYDIMLGRWPAKETQVTDLITIVQKTIDYETIPDIGPNVHNWRRNGLLVSQIGFDEYTIRAKPYFSDIDYDTNIVRQPENPVHYSFKDSINYYLNEPTEGAIILTYGGHGAQDKWIAGYGSREVAHLINNDRLPIVISSCCYTACFQWDHPEYNPPGVKCFGEHFLFNNNGGCVAFYGSTILGGWSRTVNFLDHMLRYQNWLLGVALLDIDIHPLDYYCLLGDPALDLGDYTALSDYPDLVAIPRGFCISLLKPYPYLRAGDIMTIQALIHNVGHEPANNVDVKLEIKLEEFIYSTTVTIDEIGPRDTALAVITWDTGNIHPLVLGEIGDATFTVEADPNNEILESWEYNNKSSIVKKIVIYPPGWSKKITPILSMQEIVPALANLDQDVSVEGPAEIVCAGFDSIFIFDASGNYYGNWPKCFEQVYGVALADIDVNGFIDIVAVSEDSIKVYLNNNGNITFAWAGEVPTNYKFTGLPAIGHVQSGPSLTHDIVMFACPINRDYFKILVYDYDGGPPVYNWSTQEDIVGLNHAPGGPSIENLITAGQDEIVVSYPSVFGFIELRPKTEIFNAPDGHVITLDYGAWTRITPALADINSDGHPDILVGEPYTDSFAGRMHAYDIFNGEEIWMNPPVTGASINSSPAVGDIHPGPGYSGVEVAFGNDADQDAGGIYAVRRSDGNWWQPWPYPIQAFVRTSPALALLEGPFNEYPDIITGSYNWELCAFNYARESVPPYPFPLFGTPNSSVIGDIDGDSKSEIALVSNDGYLHVWKNPISYVPPFTLEWPHFHHDYQRTGLYGWVGGLSESDTSPREFSDTTTISFTLNNTVHTRIKIYDTEANTVKTLVNRNVASGFHHIVWEGKDNNNNSLPNGTYFVEIRIRNETKIIPVVINR